MKIFNILTFVWLTLTITTIQAQDGSPSPYSFFGMGDPAFKGTVENIGMGGINVYTDSIHYNINTPAALSQLKLVNLNLAMSNNFTLMADQNKEQWVSAHNITYFSLAIPVGKKMGIGFGLLPVSSSAFAIYTESDLGTYTFKGDGGNARLFLAGAYQVIPGLSVGGEYQYYFGFLKHENYWVPNEVYSYTKELNNLDFSGSTFKFSTQYTYSLKKNHYINATANYRLAADLKADYNQLAQIITPSIAGEEVVETLREEEKQANITYPSAFDFGLGYGEKNHWFIGANYKYTMLSDFRNPFFDPAYIQYKDGFETNIGGMYVPQYNSVSKYWKRITYRAGGYFKNTGMNIYGEDITDFGITFGLGLPAIRSISNLNLGIELGQRGKITDKLVQERYINLHISISLNDKWFIKRKIN